MKTRRTTVTLDEDVARSLQAEMRRTGKTFKEAVNQALRRSFVLGQVAKSVPPFQVSAKPLGERPGLNYDCIGELLEQVDGPFYK